MKSTMKSRDEVKSTKISEVSIEDVSLMIETSVGVSHFEKNGKADSEMITTFLTQLNAIGFQFGVISYEDAAEKIAKSINDSKNTDRE